MKILSKTTLVALAVVTLVLLVVALATEKWRVADLGMVKVSQGLWKKCGEQDEVHKCQDTLEGESDEKKKYIKACRVLASLAVASLVAMAGIVLLSPRHKRLAVVLGVVCALSAVLAFSLWVAKTGPEGLPDDSKPKIGYSAVLELVGGVCAVGASCLAAHVL